MKEFVPLVLSLCLLAGCGEKPARVNASISPSPVPTISPAPPTPEPTEAPTPTPTPTPIPTPSPEPTLPAAALALLELADTDYVMDKAAGDLNGDGIEDWAVVVEHLEGVAPESFYRDAPRTLAILLDDGKGGCTLGQTNDRFIRRASQGGVSGDPYMGISIENGELGYSTYGGSALRWSEGYTFHWVGDGLELKSFGSRYFWVYDSHSIYSLYDFTTGEYTRRFQPHEGEDGGMVIWRQGFSAVPPRLEDMKGAGEGWAWEVELPPLPSPGGYMSAPPVQDPEKLLDKVREKYYPDMRRVDIPWTEETRANYSAALGYPAPGYYYTDGQAVLYYSELEVQGEAQLPYSHSVKYEGKDYLESWEDYEIYHYLDETGEEWGTNP